MGNALFFPSLDSGALVQYPLRRKLTRRTVANVLQDGSMIAAADSGIEKISWTLSYAGLSKSEALRLRDFFDSVEGTLESFVFVDPWGNLLADSADLQSQNWRRSGSVTVTGTEPAPVRNKMAVMLTNSGSQMGTLAQTLGVPACYTYCLSAYARSLNGSSVTLQAQSSGGSQTSTFQVGQAWSRVAMTVSLGDPSVGVDFAFGLAPSAQLSLACAQVEAQSAASEFRPTGPRPGVYAGARFATDVLTLTEDDLNSFRTTFELTAAR